MTSKEHVADAAYEVLAITSGFLSVPLEYRFGGSQHVADLAEFETHTVMLEFGIHCAAEQAGNGVTGISSMLDQFRDPLGWVSTVRADVME